MAPAHRLAKSMEVPDDQCRFSQSNLVTRLTVREPVGDLQSVSSPPNMKMVDSCAVTAVQLQESNKHKCRYKHHCRKINLIKIKELTFDGFGYIFKLFLMNLYEENTK